MNESTQQLYPQAIAYADAETRQTFFRKTYSHLAFAIMAFVFVEYFLLQSPFAIKLASVMTRGFTWLLVLGAFMLISHLANRWALNATSRRTQYIGLGVYILAEAIIFLPILLYANAFAPETISTAFMLTMLLFAGLTYTAFTSGVDFSFLGGFLKIGFFIAIGIILASFIFGFSLGLIFSGAMILFASAAILYSTSNVMRHYHAEQYVAASLSLFAAVALLFWYILQFLLQMASGD